MEKSKVIFLKYWFLAEPLLSNIPYYLSIIPGLKEGVSGSMVSVNNLGIIKNNTEEKKKASIEVLKFFASEEYQKKMFEKKICLTALSELWNNEEVCENGLCDLVKEVQFTGEPKFIKEFKMERTKSYDKKFKKYIYQFLYENKTIEETLKKITDITKVYYISLNTENTYVGLFYFIFISTISILMLLSLIVLFNDNFNPFFMFLSSNFWIITVLGSIMILWVPILNYGEIKEIKCYLKLLLLSIGYTLNFFPTIHKLISQFPEERKITKWIIKHKYMYLLLNILIDALLSSLSLIKPHSLKLISVEEGESFEICKYNEQYNVIILLLYKIMVMLLMLFIIFVEWNISEIMYDIKFAVSALYIDMLSIILLFVFNFIQIKYYKFYFIIQTINISIISISNYIFLYGIRVFLGFIRKQNVKLQFINHINESFINNETQLQTKSYNTGTINYTNNSIYKTSTMDENEGNEVTERITTCKSNFISRMIDYHYSDDS